MSQSEKPLDAQRRKFILERAKRTLSVTGHFVKADVAPLIEALEVAEAELATLRSPNATRGSLIAEKFIQDGDTRYAPDGQPGIYIGEPGQDVKVVPAGFAAQGESLMRLRRVIASLVDRELEGAIRKCADVLTVAGQKDASEILEASLSPLPSDERMTRSIKQIEEVRTRAVDGLETVQNKEDFEKWRIAFLGTSGLVRNLHAFVPDTEDAYAVAVRERVQAVKREIEAMFEAKRPTLKK